MAHVLKRGTNKSLCSSWRHYGDNSGNKWVSDPENQNEAICVIGGISQDVFFMHRAYNPKNLCLL